MVSWNVVGLSGDQAESNVTHISVLVQWHVLLLQECFKKLDGVNVGVHEPSQQIQSCGSLRSGSRLVIGGDVTTSSCGMTHFHHIGACAAHSCSGRESVCGDLLDGLEQRKLTVHEKRLE